jgi:hypothetical protein
MALAPDRQRSADALRYDQNGFQKLNSFIRSREPGFFVSISSIFHAPALRGVFLAHGLQGWNRTLQNCERRRFAAS